PGITAAVPSDTEDRTTGSLDPLALHRSVSVHAHGVGASRADSTHDGSLPLHARRARTQRADSEDDRPVPVHSRGTARDAGDRALSAGAARASKLRSATEAVELLDAAAEAGRSRDRARR